MNNPNLKRSLALTRKIFARTPLYAAALLALAPISSLASVNVGAAKNTSDLDGTTAVFNSPGGVISAQTSLTLADSLDLTANAGTFNTRFRTTTLNGLISGANNLSIINNAGSPGDLKLTQDHVGFTGAITITNQAQLILLSGANLSATTGITIDGGATLLTSQANQINNAAD